MNQPFAELARQLLEVQEYPDLREFPDGPPDQPYDAAGWTLPFQMGVTVMAAKTPLTAEARAAMRPLGTTPVTLDPNSTADAAPFDSVPGPGFDTNPVAAAIVPPAGKITGSGPALAIDRSQNNAFRAVNMAWKAGATVRVDPAHGGRFVIAGMADAAARRMVESLALQVERAPAAGTDLARPRIGLYQPWNASMDAGWTQWLLENYGFEFSAVRPADVKAGGLNQRYDVLIIADENARSLLDGFGQNAVPPAFTGGIGTEGVQALEQFITAGGTLVCFNGSANFAIAQFKLPVKNAAAGLRRQQFFASGSLLQVTTDPAHPLMAGMPEQAAVFFDNSPILVPADGFTGDVLAKYQAEGSPLMSGYLLGEQSLQGRAAALDVRHGNGHVVLIGFRPQWRGQPFGTFRVVFNAALYHGAVAAAAKGTPGFAVSVPAASGVR